MKIRMLFLFYSVSTLFFYCGDESPETGNGASMQEKIVITVAHDAKGNHPYVHAMERFKVALESETNGEVEVSIFPYGQLGNEDQLIQAVNLGTLDATVISAGNTAPLVPELDLFNLPFIFRDVDHFYSVLDGSVGRLVGRAIEKNLNCVFIDYMTIGTRNVWNNERPITSLEDFNGLKIRVMGSPILLDTFNAFGAQATNMAWGELYSALQMKVIEGAESSSVDLLAERFYEVSKYVTFTKHSIGPAPFVFNRNKFDQYPPHIQAAILKTGREATLAARQADETFDALAREQLEELGMEFFNIDREQFVDAVQPVYEKYAPRVGGMKLIEQIMKQ